MLLQLVSICECPAVLVALCTPICEYWVRGLYSPEVIHSLNSAYLLL